MSMPHEASKPEYSSTYFVQDRQNEREMQRLLIQDRMVTDAFGGVWPEQTDPTRIRRVLDVGCGPGGWALDVAQAYPEVQVEGIDISQRMVAYAREQAAARQVADRVTFHVMDALRMLEFPDAYFEDGAGLIAHLPRLLTQHGWRDVQTRAYVLSFRAGTPEGQAYYEDMAHVFQTTLPFIRKWGCAPADYDAIYQQALLEMQQSDFHVSWHYLTAWGRRPR